MKHTGSGGSRWRSWLTAAALLGAAIGCGLTATGAVLGGETHFLGSCGAGCADGLSCLDGICTRPCGDTAGDCADLGADVSCRQEPAQARCDLACTTDASCAAAGPGLVCEDGFCRARAATTLAATSAAVDTSDPWWCLGLTPDPLPVPENDAVTTLLAPVVDYNTRAPLAGQGLVATLCSALDPSCSTPLVAPFAVAADMLGDSTFPAGIGGMSVPWGFSGFIRFEMADADYLSVDYFLGGSASGQAAALPPILMVTAQMWDTLLRASFPNIDIAAALAGGALMAGISDCNGNPVDGARVEIAGGGSSGALAAFALPASRIPVAQPLDQARSLPAGFGYLGIPPGAVQLSAYRPEDDQLIGRLELLVGPGRIGTGLIRPAYFLDTGVPNGGALSNTEGLLDP